MENQISIITHALEEAFNFRLTNIQSALGLAQLESLTKYIKKKKIIHEKYKDKIKKISKIISELKKFNNG